MRLTAGFAIWPRRRPAGRRPPGDRGSMTLEFVLLAPVLIGLMFLLLLAGRVVEAHGQVDGAARDAARAASVARSPGEANQAADAAVSSDINGWCHNPTVSGFAVGSPAVTIQLHCTLNLSFIGFGSVNLSGTAVAPLDPFVSRIETGG
jgi:hypothetical protein